MTHVHVDLGAYVLAALEPPEEEPIRAHLADGPECAAAHAGRPGPEFWALFGA
jgi:anti-sigma factor RsiW